jgi:iron complex outermembrane receptor protein
LVSLSQYTSLIPKNERYSGVASADFALSDRITLFTDILYSHNKQRGTFSPNGLYDQAVPASNPYNPFGVPVSVNYLLTGLGVLPVNNTTDSYRGVAGAKGKLGDWDWEASVLGISETGLTFFWPNAVDYAKLSTALANPDPTQALNVFGSGLGGSPSLLASLTDTPPRDVYKSRAFQEQALIRGPILTLPAGPVAGAVGIEARSEKVIWDLSYPPDFPADRHTVSTYAEVSVPITAPSMSLSGLERLEVSFAGRFDHYSDFGSTFNPQYGIVWSPLRHVLIRATYSTSFAAPALYNLYLPRHSFGEDIVDPLRNNQTETVEVTQGGSPDLRPEKGKSGTVGFVISPGDPERLRFAATYWRIREYLRVHILDVPTVLENTALFPDRVVRAPASAQDVASGIPGTVLSVDQTQVNFGGVDTSGIDLEVTGKLDMPLGTLSARSAATWIKKYDQALFPNSPTLNLVGLAQALGTVPRWRANGTITWIVGGASLSASTRFVSAYSDTMSYSAIPNGRTIPSQTLVDLQAAFDIGKLFALDSPIAKGSTLRFGAINLFNKLPSYASTSGVGYDTTQGDIRGRFLYVSLSKAF